MAESREAKLARAAESLVALDPTVWYDQASAFTCDEVERIADLYRAAGERGVAKQLIDIHAEGDEEGDRHYRKGRGQSRTRRRRSARG